ncbi:MAG: hypothetical protein WC946_11395 [Bacteroidales bacterium]|jgi:hypothetical protein
MKTYTLKQILLLITGLISVSCTKYTSDNEIIYYDVYGEGYVYYRDTNVPIEGIEIQMKTDVDWQWGDGFIRPSNPVETLKTDANGYYRVHFIKKIYGKYPVRYLFVTYSEVLIPFAGDSCWTHSGGPEDEISVNYIDKAKQTIKFDTMKYYKTNCY